ncbi:carbohydrate ABC transporter ATP-binding protein, CUT1 family [Octadecabacter temperatus]|uniref:sn-glycerol-3-phosphate import ATP-binding protein UgpC n=1 Tax=Octadecabacter temperatus TaxID=1458307 RepID=A0A0K0Y841_9RHOB|nr:sn-glycerol-3-phosphate ABC transporter ATP-binding protein UgpC [Octadecabacter temperatus]AKS47080.1 sn-glycerol-3-phosphate import ATP-binding protein UgpC [Octadecabacter temperatus]SIO46719.1 carbohydrate ABC transporter ATP-binding protein, CUT1 family [Octadecabacter temperatus]
MGTLKLDNITKSYGAVEVLHGINFDVAEGEFIALVGPSGCGKSTLLRMIAGLEAVTSGEISMGDKVVNEVAPAERDVAMVFQSYALYPHMTVRQNMGFALEMASVPKAEAAKSVEHAANILGLTPYLKRRPKELSGGQMQRVAMGRAIVRNPEIFLFDEPLSNLDAQLRGQVRGEIQTLHDKLKTTTIYVTHDQVEAMTLADRLVVLRAGHVEQIGTPLDLYDRPLTPFVAGFIGAPPMNLFEGSYAAGALTLQDSTKLVVATGIHLAQEDTTIIGVRPEHLHRAAHGWPAKVTLVETMGHETHVSAMIGETAVTYTMTTRDFPKAGDDIFLSPDPTQLHVFRNGERQN